MLSFDRANEISEIPKKFFGDKEIPEETNLDLQLKCLPRREESEDERLSERRRFNFYFSCKSIFIASISEHRNSDENT